jgi:hypothetical protein
MKRTFFQKVSTMMCLILFGLAVGPNVASADFRFIAWGDTKDGYPELEILSPYALAKSPQFTIFVGDLELNGFTTTGMDVWKNAMNGGTGNGLFDITFSVRGNHDSSNLTGWQEYYDFSATASAVGLSNYSTLKEDVTYSFDYNNSHFVALDVPGDASLMTNAQISWLDSDLTAAEGRGMVHAFIWLHGPPYCVSKSHCNYTSKTGDASPSGFWTAMNNHPFVTAIFAGHEHIQVHTVLDNTRVTSLTRSLDQFVVGAAGAVSVDPASCSYTNRWSWCSVFDGYATVDVAGSATTVAFYDGTASSPTKTFIIDTGNLYTVSTSAGTGGSISPASRSVNYGNTTIFTITPDSGYDIASAAGCGGSLNGNTYTTGAVTANCTVTATFTAISASTSDGDLDGGGVSTTDALRALRIAAGLIAPTSDDLAHGDVAPLVNGAPHPDGKIDVGDVVVILRKALGMINW